MAEGNLRCHKAWFDKLWKRDTAARLAQLAGEITSDPNVRLPGRRSQGARRNALINGITVEDDVMAAIRAIATA